ncbi:MAG TPA: homoserine kinase [Burkholderiales bacterium]|nr:homoserine kinase [Burkholderiales bacterium]
MSVFTTVTHQQLDAWLKNYSIGTLRDLAGITAGIENTNYFVTTTAGRFVLTLFEKLKSHELPFYLNLMAHLAGRGVPAPQPIANRSDAFFGELNGKPAALVSFLSGKDLARVGPAHCRLVGAMLADIHVAGRTYGSVMENPRGPRWWRSVMPELRPFLDPGDAALLREEVDFQSFHRLTDLPRGAIHADLFRDNVLFEDDRVSGVIDFYFACTDALLYDVAITVNDWCVDETGALDPVHTQALIEAYRAIRPFLATERGAWHVMVRAAALRFWVSRLYDFHLPRPGELTHAKDPDHFRRILTQHIARARELPQLAG